MRSVTLFLILSISYLVVVCPTRPTPMPLLLGLPVALVSEPGALIISEPGATHRNKRARPIAADRERILIASGVCGDLKGCYGLSDMQECKAEDRCLCSCIRGIDVALYIGIGTSARGVNNTNKVLSYAADIRVHRLKINELVPFLRIDTYDVVYFPGGRGSTEWKHIGAAGAQAVKNFLASGGGYVGVCAGAYLALQHLMLVPFINAARPYGKRGKGNCSLALSPGSGLLRYGVANDSLSVTSVFYSNGPIMKIALSSSAAIIPNVSDARVHVSYAAPVPWRADRSPPYPADARPYDLGVGLAAVVSATFAGLGTVVVVGPHAETDPRSFPAGQPASDPRGPRAMLLQSFVRYAAAPQPHRGTSTLVPLIQET